MADLFDFAARNVPPAPLTPTQLATAVKGLRDVRGWTQATLAELSGVSERSIRRVERGEAADRDTLRAIARAFEFEDLDIFTKPHCIPTADQIAEHQRLLDAGSVVVAVETLSGRTLRDLLERTDALLPVYGCTDAAAEARFASLADLVRDYLDARADMTETFKLEMQREFDVAIDVIRSVGHAVVGGVRRVRMRSAFGEKMSEDAVPMCVLYFKCEPGDKASTSLRVLRQVQFGF